MKLPSPIRTTATAGFFDAAKRGELAIQQCVECKKFQLHDGRYCNHCYAETNWVPASGEGIVETFTIVPEASHPGFRELVPYAVASVRLSEGPLLSLRVAGLQAEQVEIGMPLKIDYLDTGGQDLTPIWTPASR